MDAHERGILEDVSKKVDKIDKQVSQIHQTVFGVESQGGLVRQAERHEASIKDLDNFKTKVLASVLVIMVGFEILLKFLK